MDIHQLKSCRLPKMLFPILVSDGDLLGVSLMINLPKDILGVLWSQYQQMVLSSIGILLQARQSIQLRSLVGLH